MSTHRATTPSYRLHKPSGQAVVTLANRDYYLGRYETPESRAESLGSPKAGNYRVQEIPRRVHPSRDYPVL